ncbi:hypothetical protein PENTCL1PPCAC_1326, partial [Pristionchus entomophagus]
FLYTLTSSCIGCIRMVPTDSGIPATMTTTTPKPLICSALSPADLGRCMTSSGRPCTTAVLLEPVTSCVAPNTLYVETTTAGTFNYLTEIRCDSPSKTWQTPTTEIITPTGVACVTR